MKTHQGQSSQNHLHVVCCIPGWVLWVPGAVHVGWWPSCSWCSCSRGWSWTTDWMIGMKKANGWCKHYTVDNVWYSIYQTLPFPFLELWATDLHLMQRECLIFLIWRTTDEYSHVLPAVAVMIVRVEWGQKVMEKSISGGVSTTWGQLWLGRPVSKKKPTSKPNQKPLRRRSAYFKVFFHHLGLTLQWFLFHSVSLICGEECLWHSRHQKMGVFSRVSFTILEVC